MTWISGSKFLTGLLAVTLLGVGVLGYLLMSARAEYGRFSDTYRQQANELARLRSLKPYPDQENLEKLLAQKKAYTEMVAQVREKLASAVGAIEPMTPEQFQDKLRAAVSEVQKLADEQKVGLFKDFYLGFPEYQTSPPRSEASPRLGWQLQAISLVIKKLIENRVTEIAELKRDPLPEESGSKPSPPARERGGPGPEGGTPEFVERYPFNIVFKADQSRFRATLNQLSNTKEHFLIVETLKVVNEQATGPARGAKAGIGASVAPGPGAGGVNVLLGGAAATGSAAPRLQFVVGTEKLDVTMRVAAVDFMNGTGENKKPGRK
jgi:hypothetical protein